MINNGIGLNASEVEVLIHPTDFYHLLLSNIASAKERLILR